MTYQELFCLLQKKGIPYADIRVVFDSYFAMPIDRLGIYGNQEVNKDYKTIVSKLEQGYPANYIAGYVDMLSLHLFLNKDTLIPRNETAQFIHEYLKEQVNFNCKKVLDLCTGSGFIALALKKYFPDAIVYASDICQNALNAAKKSAEYNQLDVTFLRSDFLENIEGSFDYIVCNPPYIEENSPDVDAPFEPPLALFSGKDGLDSYRKIFKALPKHFTKKGEAFFELESTNSQKTKELFLSMYPTGYDVSIWKDLYGRDRYLIIKSIS